MFVDYRAVCDPEPLRTARLHFVCLCVRVRVAVCVCVHYGQLFWRVLHALLPFPMIVRALIRFSVAMSSEGVNSCESILRRIACSFACVCACGLVHLFVLVF